MKFAAILPHIRKYGGVRRYLSMGTELVRLGHYFTLYVTDFSDSSWVDELGFEGNLVSTDELKYASLDVLICGDASSLSLLDVPTNVRHKIVNVIFPPFSSYLLGNYGEYLNKYIVVGNSTDWNGPLPWQQNWHTIAGAVDTNLFYPAKKPENDTPFRILFMAKARPWKGLDTISEVIRNMQGIEWHSFDVEEHKELNDLNVSQHCNIPQKEMRKLYSSCHAFLSCEKLAGWQNTVAEAMACGVPCITTEIGTRDFALHNRTAIVIPEDDVSATIRGIQTLRISAKLRSLMGKAAHATMQFYSWRNYAAEWVKFIHKLDGLIKVQTEPKTVEPKTVEPKTVEPKTVESEVQPEMDVSSIEELGSELREEVLKSDSTPENVESETNDLKEAIRQKASFVYKVIGKSKANSHSRPFDKYDKLGAYHWLKNDAVYERNVAIIKDVFSKAKDRYGSTVLDIGCGDGRLTGELAALGLRVIGIDVNETGVRFAKEKLAKEISENRVSIFCKDFFENELPEVDMILAADIIEHLWEPEKFLSMVFSLNPKFALFATPIAKDTGMWDANYHVKEYSLSDFESMFEPYWQWAKFHLRFPPYNQYMMCESKEDLIRHTLALNNVNIEGLVDTLMENITNEVKRGEIE